MTRRVFCVRVFSSTVASSPIASLKCLCVRCAKTRKRSHLPSSACNRFLHFPLPKKKFSLLNYFSNLNQNIRVAFESTLLIPVYNWIRWAIGQRWVRVPDFAFMSSYEEAPSSPHQTNMYQRETKHSLPTFLPNRLWPLMYGFASDGRQTATNQGNWVQWPPAGSDGQWSRKEGRAVGLVSMLVKRARLRPR